MVPRRRKPKFKSGSDLQDKIIPDVALFAAPGGDLSLGQTLQQPAGTTSLDALAGNNLTVAAITVNGTDPRSATPSTIDDSLIGSLGRAHRRRPRCRTLRCGHTNADAPCGADGRPGDQRVDVDDRGDCHDDLIASDRRPRHLLGLGPAQSSNIRPATRSRSSRPVAISSFPTPVERRARICSSTAPATWSSWPVRNIDLSTSGGIQAIGNRQNPALPATSGNITVLAGVILSSGDYAQAVAWFFPLLGGTGIAGHAGDLKAQLAAFAAGKPLPAIGSSEAIAFSALPVDSQVTQTKHWSAKRPSMPPS